MRATIVPGIALAAMLAASVAGCGTTGDTGASGRPTQPTTKPPVMCPGGPLMAMGSADVNGDGTPDPIDFAIAAGAGCPAGLHVRVGSASASIPFTAGLPVTRQDVHAVRLPGHTGDAIVLVQHSPRGGFAVTLSAWSGTDMRAVDLGLGFTATDAATRYVTAACTADGFTVTEAQPPASGASVWDVYRTTYGVNGDAFSVSPRIRIATAVTDMRLRAAYPDLVRGRLFENCGPGAG